MTSRLRTTSLAIVAALGLIALPLAVAAPAASAPLTNVLFFSNGGYTDPGTEDAFWIDSLEAMDVTVTVFDGGDGSAEAWATALTGQQVFAFPEHSDSLFGPAISVEAVSVITEWVAAGGLILASSDYDFILTSAVTGIDYTDVPDNYADYYGPWPLVSDMFPGSPAELSETNGTAAYNSFAWTEEQLAGVTPLYLLDGPEADDVSFVSGFFPAGAGGVVYLGYDWFPDEEEAALQAQWNAFVEAILDNGLAVEPPPPAPVEPQLAATGSSVDSTLIGAGAVFLLLAGAVVLMTRRARA